MRVIPLAVLFTLMIPFAAVAQNSTMPSETAKDQQQFAKLGALVGTWNYTDTPASKVPHVQTVTQQGNWIVFRETGDSPSTTYLRWSYTRQMYIANFIGDVGSTSILTTTSSDPSNAAWQIVWPPDVPKGVTVTTAMSGNTFTLLSTQPDQKGNVMTEKSACTKG